MDTILEILILALLIHVKIIIMAFFKLDSNI